MSDEKLISLGDDEKEIEIDLEEGTVEAKAEPEAKDVDQKPEEQKTLPKEDELEQYSDSVKKRIEKLTFKYREAERREQAAVEFAKSLKAELETVRQKSQQLDTSLLNEATNRIKTQEQLINDRLRLAIDRGDVDGQISAQRELANLAVENERLRQAQVRREYEADQQRRAFVQPEPQQQVPVAPDRKATEWAEKNQWFGQDEPMTFTAFSIHKNLVELEGFDPTSDEYYSELDKRIRREFPHKFAPSETKQKPSPMVASANGSQRAENRKQVKLTPSQVAIAKRLGVSLKDYARQLQRLNG
jgi:hypothetical protein